MDAFRVLEIKKSVFENNDRQADLLREELKRNHTFLLNLMSSPGSGKTTTLMATINALKDDLRIGVMEADIDSDVDAATISTSGVHPIPHNPATQPLKRSAASTIKAPMKINTKQPNSATSKIKNCSHSRQYSV